MTQRNKIYQGLDTHTILVSRIQSLLVLAFSWDLLTIKKLWIYVTIFSSSLYNTIYITRYIL